MIGAGAIGVSFAAELKRAGNGVVLVARGAQLEAARRGGITYVRPDGARPLDVGVVGSPEELELRHDDIIVLATKTQDVASALTPWAGRPVSLADGGTSTAGASLPLLTTQNGLAAEDIALRFFATVIGGVIAMPAHYVEAGVVVAAGSPAVGSIWLGIHPDGEERLAFVQELARALRRANFDPVAVSDISAWKRAKLVASSTFILDALYGPTDLRGRLADLVRAETRSILEAVGPVADFGDAMSHRATFRPVAVPGYAYGGTSSWQSLARGTSLETDYLNGEVVLQARLQGRGAPVNETLTQLARFAAAGGQEPRALGDDDILATFPQLGSTALGRGNVLVEADTLARELEAGTAPALLDVRWKLGDAHGAEHYAEGHIPGAVYVDLDRELAAAAVPDRGRHPLPELADLEIAAQRWGLRDGQPVVVYDDNGGTSAARAWWLLRWAGVPSVRILDGALGAWRAAGLPLDTGTPEVAGGDVRLGAGHLPLLSADQAADLPESGVLLDARAGERYRGEVEPVDPRAGHIPGALSAPTTDNLAEDGRFLDDEALTRRFEELGVDSGSSVGVYCGSGVTAAHEIAALAVLGIEAALFPGSWSAWSSDPDRPAATGATPLSPASNPQELTAHAR